jgi:3-oxoacyl-[acyl-carrier protein] reductase
VTGAARGIGKSIALALSAQGAHVVFNYRGDESKAMSLKEELEKVGGKATGLKFDVTDYESMTKAIDEFTKSVGPISGLVNNAGVSKDTLLLRLKPDEISSIIDTNLKGAWVSWEILLRRLMQPQKRDSLVFQNL